LSSRAASGMSAVPGIWPGIGNVVACESFRRLGPLRPARRDLVEHLGVDQDRLGGLPGAVGGGRSLHVRRTRAARCDRRDGALVAHRLPPGGRAGRLSVCAHVRARLLGRAVHPVRSGSGAVRRSAAVRRAWRCRLPSRPAAPGERHRRRPDRDRRARARLRREHRPRRRRPRGGGRRGARGRAAGRRRREHLDQAARRAARSDPAQRMGDARWRPAAAGRVRARRKLERVRLDRRVGRLDRLPGADRLGRAVRRAHGPAAPHHRPGHVVPGDAAAVRRADLRRHALRRGDHGACARGRGAGGCGAADRAGRAARAGAGAPTAEAEAAYSASARIR
jgi:hypothetical protein